MDNNEFDLSVFERAVNSFRKVIYEYEKDKSNDFIRDSCIQRFEYCYHLAIRYIERYLTLSTDYPDEVKELTLPEKIREAYKKGVLKHSWDAWKDYRDKRNATSHGYNEEKAIDIVNNLDLFLDEIVFLLEKLKEKNEA